VSNGSRQRWRLVVARDEAARDLLHRDVTAAWDAGLAASGLPLQMSEGATPRPRVTFAAPAPVGMLAERELIDIVLTGLVPLHEVRSAVEAAAPDGYRAVDVFDVWLGWPALAALVVAGDYRASVTSDAGEGDDAGPLGPSEVEAAIAELLAAPRIEQPRSKGQGMVTIDIRPHIRALRVTGSVVGPSTRPAVELWMQLRLGGEGGVGRPEEVVAALGERLGRVLVSVRLTRERIVLADDPDA
jgi:radical SAM-linked protein